MNNEGYIKAFLDDCKIRGYTKSTLDGYRRILNRFAAYLQGDIVKVGIEEFKRYLQYMTQERDLSKRSIRHYFDTLGSFYDYLEFDEIIDRSPYPRFRRTYLSNYKKNEDGGIKRQIISVEQMSDLVSSIFDPRDKAIVTLFAKTGIRLGELIAIDMKDIDWDRRIIHVKENGKRSYNKVLFDDEAERVLKRWIRARENIKTDGDALFVNYSNNHRIHQSTVMKITTKYARRLGIHKDGGRLDEKFTCHCCRHWYTTHLRKGGMPRDHIKKLRGDSMKETIDIYNHIEDDDLKESYEQCMPKLLI